MLSIGRDGPTDEFDARTPWLRSLDNSPKAVTSPSLEAFVPHRRNTRAISPVIRPCHHDVSAVVARVHHLSVPARLRTASPALVAPAVDRFRDGSADADDLRLLTRPFRAVLASPAPGAAVEVRAPPYAAVQAVGGTRHKRGTPPAVVETDAATWIGLALGQLGWSDAERAGRLVASGERSDLSALLPLAQG